MLNVKKFPEFSLPNKADLRLNEKRWKNLHAAEQMISSHNLCVYLHYVSACPVRTYTPEKGITSDN